MKSAFFLSMIVGSIVLALVVIGGTILLGIKILRDGVSGKKRHIQAEEARMIQDIYKGLSDLEARIETLETLLLDRDGKEPGDENELR